MGGKVFVTLNVPRLPHGIYNEMRLKAHESLLPFYKNVVSPPEAPSKIDHGDVDFLVANPTSEKGDSDPASRSHVSAVAIALGAIDYRHTSNSKTTHFAVPIPHRENEHAQIDVHVCPAEYYEWEIFLQSYGDLLQILGILNRPIGLTINDKGLYLRIPEIEPGNRKKAMVFLTDSPTETMAFLGLDGERYAQGFATDEVIFSWCFGGRFYGPLKQEEETSNDRNRLRKRDMFTACVREWFPTHAAELFPKDRPIWTREEVLGEVLRYFPDAKPVYEAKMIEYGQEVWEAEVLAGMRVVNPLAEEKECTEIVRGSKRFVTFDEGSGQWRLSDVILHEDVATRPEWMDYVKTGAR